MAKQNTVFISYRRTNSWTAQAVYQYLDKQGYDVFLDVDGILAGDWLETIISQIRARAHFIIILTPSAVERFKDPKDIMRLEIETAIDEKRNIIPLMFEDFDYESVKHALTGKLRTIRKYNSIEVPTRFFKYAMQELCDKWLDQDVEAVVLPTPSQYVEKVEEVQKQSHDKPEIDEKQLIAEKLYEQGLELHSQRNYEGAVAKFSEAIKTLPTYADAYYKRGHSYFDLGLKMDAYQDYEKATTVDPDHLRIHIMRANFYELQGKYDEALKEATLAIENYVKVDSAYFRRGYIHHSMKNYKEAIADYSEAIELNPQYANAFNNRGLAKHNLTDYKGAIDDFTQVLKFNPNDAIALNNRANAKFDLDDYEGAIEDYSEAIRLGVRDLMAFYNRGLARHNLEDYKGASEDYTRAITINPKYEKAYNNRGIAKVNLEDFAGAVADFEMTLALNPSHTVAKKNLDVARRKLEEQ